MRFDHFRFCVFVFGWFVHDVLGITEGSGVLGAFVSGVGFEFGAIRGAMLFDFLGVILGEFGLGGLVFGGVQVSFFLAFLLLGFLIRQFGFRRGVNLLGFVLFEFSATDEGIRFGLI
jgi:hypothetical protein